MPVKRESSPSPTPSSEPQTPKKKTKTTAASPRTPKTGKGSGPSTPSTPGSGWTSEKREALVEELLTAGLRSVKAAEIAAKIGITPQQYKDATQSGKNNLRAKVIKAAGGFGK